VANWINTAASFKNTRVSDFVLIITQHQVSDWYISDRRRFGSL